MGLDDAIESELQARRAAQRTAAEAARRRELESAWFRRRPWASPADRIIQPAPGGDVGDLLRAAVQRLPRSRWLDGLVYRDIDGARRLATNTQSAWRSRSFEHRTRFFAVDAGDGHAGDKYSNGRPPSWSLCLLPDASYAGTLGSAEAIQKKLVKIIVG